MRSRRFLTGCLMLVPWALAGGSALAQTRTISDTECKTLRERLAEHARLSDGVRRTLTAQAARYPAPPAPPAPAATPPAAAAPNRAEAIRARLAQIPTERQRLEDERSGALLRFELARAAAIQGQLSSLDSERANLERELASLPAAPAAATPAPQMAPAPPRPPQPGSDVDRIPCQDLLAAFESAVKTRQRELGAREGQTGAQPLTALKGQTPDQIARELAAQFAVWPQAATQVGLLDQDGDGRLDGFVDAPAPNVFRLYRLRPDGSVGVDAFIVSTPGTAPAYDEMTRRLEEGALRQSRRTPAELLASRPAGPLRLLGEAGEFSKAYGFALAGNFAEAARVEGGGARTVEFQNYRGETIRILEVIAPVSGGFAWRRLAVSPLPGNEEQWQESVVVVKPTSYWRTEVEVRASTERRTTAGVPVGSRSAGPPVAFVVDR